MKNSIGVLALVLSLLLLGCQARNATSATVGDQEPDGPAKPNAGNKASSDGSCGQVIQLNKEGFRRLDLPNQLSKLVDDSGFTPEELQLMSQRDMEQSAFSAYALAYLDWNKSVSRSDLDKMIQHAQSAANSNALSQADKAQMATFIQKFSGMMLRALDLGRYDAKRKPCPF